MPMKVVWVPKLESLYTFGEYKGNGTYGNVMKAINNETGQKCVCKIVERKNDYVRELDHLIALRKCYSVLPVRQAVFTTSLLCLEFEEAECNLREFVVRQHEIYAENKKRRDGQTDDVRTVLYDALSITNQMLISMAHIHANNIVHRDVKSANVVVTKDERGTRAWTIDFGMSKRIIGTPDIVTAAYRAPELFRFKLVTGEELASSDSEDQVSQSKEELARPYDKKVDVWAIGCMLFEMITGYCPFTGDDEYTIRKRIAGHTLHITGHHDKTVFSGKPDVVNLEKEIDSAISKLNHPFNRKHHQVQSQPSRKESNLRSSDYMDLCSSLDDMTVTPKKKSHSSVSISNNNNEDIVLSEDCKGLLKVAKRLIKALLYPDPKLRYDALAALNEFGGYRHQNEGILESPIELPIRVLTAPAKTSFINVMQVLWSACDRLQYGTNVIYLGLYLWIRCISGSPELCKEFSLSTIMMASIRLAVSYTGDDIRYLRHLRKIVSKGAQEKSPKREVNCASSILTVLLGRVWVLNPGDLRHFFIPGCKKDEWNSDVEKVIFGVILEMVMERFTVPDANAVIERTKLRLKRNSISRDVLINMK